MKLYTKDCGFGIVPQSRVFGHVWSNVLDEHMREFNYMANCANMSLSITPMYDNINF